ncbi:DUF6541 family protein [Microbacterium sp. P07]|uniref:DUF6541 family protein n=1 Tax=Microbacterium sp. P07 TaxID=3366952 RepID=UPI003746848C
MIETWGQVAAPFAASAIALIFPGLVVMISGWGWRRPGLLFFAPAVSMALLAVSAILAPIVGLPWSPLPVIALTVVAAVVAFFLRRWVRDDAPPRLPARVVVAAVGGFVLAAVVISAQLAWVFVDPDSISQTFDAIVHLNTVAFAIDTSNASAFHIGATSDIAFYPNAWHSVASLAAEITGVSTPVAVNSANLAIGAIAWPASCIALASAYFGDRAAAFVVPAALSTGFGAFPVLLLMFGVLYPNMAAYAVLPAGIAAVLLLCRATTVAARTRAAVLLAVASAGIGLAHPNAFLALFAFGTAIVVLEVLTYVLRERTRRSWITGGAIVAAILVVGILLWRFSRTGEDMSRWGPWQTSAQAVGEALLVSPRQYSVTVLSAALLIAGLIVIARRPRNLVVGAPFAVATVLFVLVSGTAVGNVVREALTNPWYNDSYRLAALLPVAGIPVATLGAIAIVDALSTLARRRRLPVAVTGVVATLAALALFSVSIGPNVSRTMTDARQVYTVNATSALLTADEQRLLERLPDTTPDDALIAGSPWTGTSLAYALTGRQVLEKHVFGSLSDDEEYLDAHLREIDTDPEVCAAVDRLGVDHVLDFGSQNVFNNPGSGTAWAGVNDLQPSDSLVLVDSEGPTARLFRIEGC